MEGYGHTIQNLYAGIPGGRAAIETGTATSNCVITGVYSESSIEWAIYEGANGSTPLGVRRNVWSGLHVDLEVGTGKGKVYVPRAGSRCSSGSRRRSELHSIKYSADQRSIESCAVGMDQK